MILTPATQEVSH